MTVARCADRRWTVTREFCGQPVAKWIVRFCGEWRGWCDTRAEVERLRDQSAEARLAWMLQPDV